MALLLLSLPLLLSGCGDYPVEPGSDLPAESPPAVLSDQPPAAPAPPVPTPDGAPELEGDALLDGQFAVTGTLASPLGDTITAAFTAQVVQSAPLGDPAATIDLALLDEADPAAVAPRFEAPAPLSAEGVFNGTVVDFVVPVRFSDLLRAPSQARITFAGQIVDQDCFAGQMTLNLIGAEVTVVDAPIDLTLSGSFYAERAPGACGEAV